MATRRRPPPAEDEDLKPQLEDATTLLDERFCGRRTRDLQEEIGDLPDEPPPGWCDV